MYAELTVSLTSQIWHLESGQCLFFAADSREEFQMWFKEIIRGSEYIVSADDLAVPLPTPYYYFPKEFGTLTLKGKYVYVCTCIPPCSVVASHVQVCHQSLFKGLG